MERERERERERVKRLYIHMIIGTNYRKPGKAVVKDRRERSEMEAETISGPSQDLNPGSYKF